MEFSRQEYWSGLPFPSTGDLSDPGIKPRSPTLQADSLPPEPPGKHQITSRIKAKSWKSSWKDKTDYLQREENYTNRRLVICNIRWQKTTKKIFKVVGLGGDCEPRFYGLLNYSSRMIFHTHKAKTLLFMDHHLQNYLTKNIMSLSR